MNKQEKCSITQKNRITIHLDDIEKRIYKNELEDYIIKGGIIGISDKHKLNLSETHKGKQPGNKGQTKETNESLQIISEKNSINTKLLGEDSEYVNKQLDSRLGREAGNLGLTKETDERVAKQAEKMLNHQVSEKTRQAVSENNLSGGENATEEEKTERITKINNTKIINKTFNTSKPELEMLKSLKEKYGDKNVFTNYKCDRYPFYCDFYILSEDLFIELNAHWTHGKHPFDKNNTEDLKLLNEWKEKAKTSKFYANAITVGTELDVKKQEGAKTHNLNYLIIY